MSSSLLVAMVKLFAYLEIVDGESFHEFSGFPYRLSESASGWFLVSRALLEQYSSTENCVEFVSSAWITGIKKHITNPVPHQNYRILQPNLHCHHPKFFGMVTKDRPWHIPKIIILYFTICVKLMSLVIY
ncbi:uncharacterized protein LOC126267728 [Schistocerca gregaria]|uniref:uncharacterized protein LOC126267728 n=1 Tax=Schistocerca gregaria TaxID=7010 RepID=UPI00211E69DA|nr:uncharacterized protein LOC126267728 [Schistocerca gregaria]